MSPYVMILIANMGLQGGVVVNQVGFEDELACRTAVAAITTPPSRYDERYWVTARRQAFCVARKSPPQTPIPTPSEPSEPPLPQAAPDRFQGEPRLILAADAEPAAAAASEEPPELVPPEYKPLMKKLSVISARLSQIFAVLAE